MVFFILATLLLLSGKQMYIQDPEIVVFDVGQGDSILIQQGRFQILIDGGPNDNVVYQLAQYMPLYDKNIEIVVLTHPHDDHIRGLMNVLDQYTVGEIWFNPVEYENREYLYLLANYADMLVEVEAGGTLEYMDIYIEVLYPFHNSLVKDRNINNESIVLLVDTYGYRSLFMGDAEWQVEHKLLGKYDLDDISLLKAGHHCSKTATSDMFLNTVDPDIVICSCGEGNKFGHPHYETLEKLQERNVQYLITYKEGNILLHNFTSL